jgi:hypothetical protein
MFLSQSLYQLISVLRRAVYPLPFEETLFRCHHTFHGIVETGCKHDSTWPAKCKATFPALQQVHTTACSDHSSVAAYHHESDRRLSSGMVHSGFEVIKTIMTDSHPYADLFRAPLHEVLPTLKPSPPLHVLESGGIPDMVSQ